MLQDNPLPGAHLQPDHPSVALASLGCKVNQAEVDSFSEEFARRGCRVVTPGDPADVFILNSCTVTHVADRKSRQILRQARRANPASLVVVAGCYATTGAAAEALGVDLVVANPDKPRLAELVAAALRARPSQPADPPLEAAASLGGFPPTETAGRRVVPWRRTRAMVKIQDGCDSHCTYCIVPRARGPRRSTPPDEILAQVREKVAQGYQEVVLTGVHAGAYGREPASPAAGLDLAGLVRLLLAETSVRRLRLSSVEPWDFSPRFLALWEDPRLCRHLHLPLQSGSEAVLRRMGRRYRPVDYRRLVAEIRAAVPDVAITTDVMVGFPGEIEDEHADSLRFCADLAFAEMHVFKYSRRESTPAARLSPQVPEEVKKRRSDEMIALASANASRFRRRFLGRQALILWEGLDARHPEGPLVAPRRVWEGLTDNYLRVYADATRPPAGPLAAATMVAEYGDGLWGELDEVAGACA